MVGQYVNPPQATNSKFAVDSQPFSVDIKTQINLNGYSQKASSLVMLLSLIFPATVLASETISDWNDITSLGNQEDPSGFYVVNNDLSVVGNSGSDSVLIKKGTIEIDFQDHSVKGPSNDTGGWTSLIINKEANVTLKNIGNFGDFIAGSRIADSDQFNGGWNEFNYTGAIAASYGSSLTIDHSLFQNNYKAAGAGGAAIQIAQSTLNVSNSLFLNNRSGVFGGAAIFSDAGSVNISNSTFYGNQSAYEGVQGSGGAIFLFNNDNVEGLSLSILGSYFQNNRATRIESSINGARGGAISVAEVADTLIQGSTFEDNVSDFVGGALYVEFVDRTILQDTSFINNSSRYYGAAVFYLQHMDSENFIVAKNADVIFSGNTLSGEDAAGEDIFINYSDTVLNLNAYAGRTIRFDGSITSSTTTIDDQEQLGEIHINAGEGLLTLTDDNEAVNSSSDENQGKGTIIFNDEVQYVNLHFHDGLLVLSGEHTDQGILGTSVLHLDGNGEISTVNTFKEARTNTSIKQVVLGGLRGDGKAYLSLDVDLANKVSDTFAVVDGGTVSGGATIQIDHWNVLTDADELVTVISVADDALKNRFTLSDNGTIAQGEIFSYEVSQLDDANFKFERKESSPININPDIYAGDIAMAGIGVVDHLMNDMLLSRRLSMLGDDQNERGQGLWATVSSSELRMKTGNFYQIDYLYTVGILGYTVDGNSFGGFDTQYSVYGAFVNGSHDYSDNGIEQNGVVLGSSAEFSNDQFWFALHLKGGYLNSELKLSSKDRDIETPWVGLGAVMGTTFNYGTMSFKPFVTASVIYAEADAYKTPAGVDVDSDGTMIAEFSPGFIISKDITHGWQADFMARYNFVDVSGNETVADEFQLDGIHYENYVEYGIGLQKLSDNWEMSFRLERSDDGRQGWTGFAHFGWYF